MCVLGIGIIFGMVIAEILLTVFLFNHPAGSLDIDIGKSCTVGTHVGDQTFLTIADINAFIQALGNGHGPLGRKAELL